MIGSRWEQLLAPGIGARPRRPRAPDGAIRRSSRRRALPFQGIYAGTLDESIEWLAGFVRDGARHRVLRFVDPEPESTLLTYAPELPTLHGRALAHLEGRT